MPVARHAPTLATLPCVQAEREDEFDDDDLVEDEYGDDEGFDDPEELDDLDDLDEDDEDE